VRRNRGNERREEGEGREIRVRGERKGGRGKEE